MKKRLKKKLLKKALDTINKSNKIESIILSDEDFNRFVDHLNSPPEPNQALIEAFKKYQKYYEP